MRAKITEVNEFKWVAKKYIGEKYLVRWYKATVNGRTRNEEGIAFIRMEGGMPIKVICPSILSWDVFDRFLIEPSCHGIRVPNGCKGFFDWMDWYEKQNLQHLEEIIEGFLSNRKLFSTSMLSFVKTRLEEEH